MTEKTSADIFIEFANFIGADIDNVGEHLVAHMKHPESKDLVIMLPGGKGQICITDEKIVYESLIIPTNLLDRFKKKNVASCVFNSCIELPDRYNPLLPFVDDDDVLIEKHYRQIKEVVTYYNQIYDRIWFLGHSSSATAGVGIIKWCPEFESLVDGIILINPKKIFKRPGKKYVPHFGKILNIPVLSINHARDGAHIYCPAEFNLMLSKCSKDKRSKHIMFDGGVPDGDNDPNLGFGYHGLRGLEEELVSEIVDFINTPLVDQ